jgi:hypothetical protein
VNGTSSGRKSAGATDVGVELWRSVVSLLRSYAAAASLSGTTHGVLVLTENLLNIVAVSSILKVEYFPTLKRGVWSVSGHGEQKLGNFELEADGTIIIDGTQVEMDHAVIQWIADLTHSASRNEIEVPA